MNALSQERERANTWHRRKPQIVEPTITQNGALFAVQHRPLKRKLFTSTITDRSQAANKTISTLRTSVGEFVFRQTPLGCYLELVVGNVRWALGLFGTNEAAVRVLKNGRTGFRTSDALGRKTAANQIGTLSRWNKSEQTP